MYYLKDIETASRDQIAAVQLGKLQKLVNLAAEKSRFYQAKFKEAGVVPEDIKTLDNIEKLPWTTKAELLEDQAKNPLFGSNLTEPMENFVWYAQTTGTTGKPLKWIDTHESWAFRGHCHRFVLAGAGATPKDVVLIASNFGPYTAYWGAYQGCWQLGALTIVTGGWETETRVNSLIENKATVLITTPVYAMRLAEAAKAKGVDIAGSDVTTLIIAGERAATVPAVRAKMESTWGAKCFEFMGMTELGTYAFQCAESPYTDHVIESDFILEVVNPHTGHKVAPGEIGEMVLTNITRTCTPTIRYRTGDLVKTKEGRCSCGRTFCQLDGGILGRKDDMVKVKGTNVYPSTIGNVIEEYLDRPGRYLVVAYRQGNFDLVKVQLEKEGSPELLEALKAEIGQKIKNALNVHLDVELVPSGSLPEFDYKARRFVDLRKKGQGQPTG